MKLSWRPVVSVLEKAVWQYLQAFIVGLLANQFFDRIDLGVAQVAAVAAIPTLFTVLVNAIKDAQVPSVLPLQMQIALRTLRAGAAAFGGFLIAAIPIELARVSPGAVDVSLLFTSLWHAAIGAAGVAVLTAIKGELAQFVGDPNSPATLPTAPSTQVVGPDPLTPPNPNGTPNDSNFIVLPDYDPNDPEAIGDPLSPGELPDFPESDYDVVVDPDEEYPEPAPFDPNDPDQFS
jgi:hypothetical protein